ncbi:MAG TPA: sialidase family protein, partial [Chthoniobacterales bacterium]
MRKKLTSQSGLFNPRTLLAFLLCSLGASFGWLSFASNPTSTNVTPTSSPMTWVGTAPGPATAPVDAETSCVDGVNCDTFIINLSGVKSDWANKQVHVSIDWTDATGATDYDLYIHKGTTAGTTVGESAGSDNPEAANINPNEPSLDVGTGQFTVHVIYYTATAANQYTGHVSIIDAPPPSAAPPPLSSPPPAAPGVPRYYNYSPGPGVGETAGEPTIGFNLTTKHAMYISGLQTLRVTFPDTGACDATWEDVSYVLTSKKSLDPILWTDQAIGRTFVSQLDSVVPPASPVLIGLNSLMAYTDDDGQNWTPAQLNPPDGSYDHQNVGSGPYPASLDPVLGNAVNKHRAVYYCSQAGVTAFCSRSDDGGLNFGPSRNPYSTVDGCSAIHGHVKVAPDGTVYLPTRSCGSDPNVFQSVARSTDAGETWTIHQVKGPGFTGAKPPPGILDPSIAIASDGTLYFAYISSEIDGGHARVAVSHDKAATWGNDFDIGASYGLPNAVFATAIAGDPNRAAVGFLGTTAPGNHQGPTFAGTWYVFVAHTYDGGASWTTVNATPDDPVQKESCIWNQGGSNPCRNLLDFTGITKDDKGRVLYAYADGCIGDCVTGGPNSFSS